jgi:rare lipoprotein A
MPALPRLPLTLLCAVLLIAGCASTPRPGPTLSTERDGVSPDPPRDLEQTPDALPEIEAIRQGGPNKPYSIDGRSYVPETRDVPLRQRGLASWYGRKFHGRLTANGETYNMYAMTAAHPTMPLPSYAHVRNPANGREVIVRVNDRGPFVPGRIIDLSYTAALRLGLLRGVAPVEVERITHDAIRTGAWRKDGERLAQAPPPAAPVAPSPVALTEAAPPAAPAPAAAPAADTSGAAATSPAPVRPIASAAPGFWVQLGAFRERRGAESFQHQVASELQWIAPLLALFADSALHRLQAGPYATRDEAASVAERLRDTLKLVPVIVERR